jgi:hypothetical protein
MGSPFYDDVFITNGNNVVVPDIFEEQRNGRRKSSYGTSTLLDHLSRYPSTPQRRLSLAVALNLTPLKPKSDVSLASETSDNENGRSSSSTTASTTTSTCSPYRMDPIENRSISNESDESGLSHMSTYTRPADYNKIHLNTHNSHTFDPSSTLASHVSYDSHSVTYNEKNNNIHHHKPNDHYNSYHNNSSKSPDPHPNHVTSNFPHGELRVQPFVPGTSSLIETRSSYCQLEHQSEMLEKDPYSYTHTQTMIEGQVDYGNRLKENKNNANTDYHQHHQHQYNNTVGSTTPYGNNESDPYHSSKQIQPNIALSASAGSAPHHFNNSEKVQVHNSNHTHTHAHTHAHHSPNSDDHDVLALNGNGADGIVEVQDLGQSERDGQQRDIEHIQYSLKADGFKSGAYEGEQSGLQEGFFDGFHEGLEKGMRIGNIYGTLTIILVQLNQQREAKKKANNLLIASCLSEQLASSNLSNLSNPNSKLNPNPSDGTANRNPMGKGSSLRSNSLPISSNSISHSKNLLSNNDNDMNNTMSNNNIYNVDHHDEVRSEEELEKAIETCNKLVNRIRPFILNPNDTLTEVYLQDLHAFFISIGYDSLTNLAEVKFI